MYFCVYVWKPRQNKNEPKSHETLDSVHNCITILYIGSISVHNCITILYIGSIFIKYYVIEMF